MNSGKVSLILPVHNEADNIETVVKGFYQEISPKVNLEIVVAEDGSTDGTKEVLGKLSKEVPIVLLMENERMGYTGGLKRGLEKATGDYILFCDSDGQHFPADFWKLYDAMDGNDMVDGWRVNRADTRFRKIMSGTFQSFAKILFGLRGIADITAPYRLVKKDLAVKVTDQVKYMRESFWTEFTIRAAGYGAKIKEVPVEHRLRLSGDTVVYKASKIPKIVYSQFSGMLKLRWELSTHPKA
jgi:glycosyltransferase involved in cell wall biosynthesis